MKKIKVLVIGSVPVILGITACKKEQMTQVEPTASFDHQVHSSIPYSSIKKINKGYTGPHGSREILSFPDMATFKLVMNDLKNQLAEYDKAFMNKYPNLDM